MKIGVFLYKFSGFPMVFAKLNIWFTRKKIILALKYERNDVIIRIMYSHVD